VHSHADSPLRAAAPQPGNVQIPAAVIGHVRHLHGAEFKVLLVLSRHQGQAGASDQEPFPYSIPQIEDDTGLCPRAISQAISRLEQRGLIERLKKHGARPNRYRVPLEPAAPPPKRTSGRRRRDPRQRVQVECVDLLEGFFTADGRLIEDSPIPERRQEIPMPPALPPARPAESAAATPAAVVPPSPTTAPSNPAVVIRPPAIAPSNPVRATGPAATVTRQPPTAPGNPVVPAAPAVATPAPPTPPAAPAKPVSPSKSIPAPPAAPPPGPGAPIEDLVAYLYQPVTKELIWSLETAAGNERDLRHALQILCKFKQGDRYQNKWTLIADIRSL